MSPRQMKGAPLLFPSCMGGRTFADKSGYILEHAPWHPEASPREGYVRQHRLVAELFLLQRSLLREEIVHHIDENKQNNDPENLMVFPNAAAHSIHHRILEGGIHSVTEDMIRETLKTHSLRKTCRALGITRTSIVDRYPHLIPEQRQMPTREEVQEAIQIHKTAKKAAQVLGVSSSYLRYKHPDLLVRKGTCTLHEDQVRAALQGRTTLEAAILLGVAHQTLRDRFPHLLQKRRTPCNPNDPKTIQLVLEKAKDKFYSIRQLSQEHGISSKVAADICLKFGVTWERNYDRKGVSGRPKIAIQQALIPCDRQAESVLQMGL